MENTSVFTKIITGEVPCYKVYEDEASICFLDINPLADGHVLIVPKMQINQIWELPDDHYYAVWATARKVAKRMQEVLNPIRVGIVVEGLGVPNHAHIHLVPIYNKDVLQLHHGYPVNTYQENMIELAGKLFFTD